MAASAAPPVPAFRKGEPEVAFSFLPDFYNSGVFTKFVEGLEGRLIFWVSHVWLVVVVISGTLDSQGPSGEPQYGSPLPLPKRRIRKREGLDPNAQE
jgi:hypothetical protein